MNRTYLFGFDAQKANEVVYCFIYFLYLQQLLSDLLSTSGNSEIVNCETIQVDKLTKADILGFWNTYIAKDGAKRCKVSTQVFAQKYGEEAGWKTVGAVAFLF